jgi:hypothetical protein
MFPVYIWILFFASVAILLLTLRIHFFNKLGRDVNLTSKEDFLRDVNTGDLLFFSGTTFSEKSIKWCHGSRWNHCSIVLRDLDRDRGEGEGHDIPFIFESDVGQGYKDGPRVMRLEDKLKRWKGDKILGWRRYMGGASPTEVKDKILEVATQFYREGYSFDNTFYSWFLSGSTLFKLVKDPKKVFCSELVADTLQKAGILLADHPPCWYTPEYFFSKVESEKGMYGVPYYVDFSDRV